MADTLEVPGGPPTRRVGNPRGPCWERSGVRPRVSRENDIDFQYVWIHIDATMLVCHCERVNDKVIRKCAREGARNHLDVALACGAGSRCGGCRPLVDEIVAETHAELRGDGLFPLPLATG